MKYFRMLPITLMATLFASTSFADDVLPSHLNVSDTPVACTLPTSSTLPDYNAKIKALRDDAEKSMMAVNAMTANMQTSSEGQRLVAQAKDKLSEAETCQEKADEMILQVIPPKSHSIPM